MDSFSFDGDTKYVLFNTVKIFLQYLLNVKGALKARVEKDDILDRSNNWLESESDSKSREDFDNISSLNS